VYREGLRVQGPQSGQDVITGFGVLWCTVLGVGIVHHASGTRYQPVRVRAEPDGPP